MGSVTKPLTLISDPSVSLCVLVEALAAAVLPALVDDECHHDEQDESDHGEDEEDEERQCAHAFIHHVHCTRMKTHYVVKSQIPLFENAVIPLQ